MKIIRRVTSAIIWAAMFAYFFYGTFRFPDGPIHPCGINRYCGKQGQPHTLRQYRAYKTWNTSLLYIWPVGLVSLALLNKSWRKPSAT